MHIASFRDIQTEIVISHIMGYDGLCDLQWYYVVEVDRSGRASESVGRVSRQLA